MSNIIFRLIRPLLSKKIVQDEVGAAEVVAELQKIGQAITGTKNGNASELQKLRAQNADTALATKEGLTT